MQHRISGIIRKVNERRQRPNTARIADAQKLVGAGDLAAQRCGYDACRRCSSWLLVNVFFHAITVTQSNG
jgi:hypothetical protein